MEDGMTAKERQRFEAMSELLGEMIETMKTQIPGLYSELIKQSENLKVLNEHATMTTELAQTVEVRLKYIKERLNALERNRNENT